MLGAEQPCRNYQGVGWQVGEVLDHWRANGKPLRTSTPGLRRHGEHLRVFLQSTRAASGQQWGLDSLTARHLVAPAPAQNLCPYTIYRQ